MNKPLITVVELPGFLRSAEAAGMSEAERGALVEFLARNPLAGAVIKDTGGLRKLRWQRDGGGYRAIYYFHDERLPIFAYLVYGKNQQENLTPAQKKSAADAVAKIKARIRERRGGDK